MLWSTQERISRRLAVISVVVALVLGLALGFVQIVRDFLKEDAALDKIAEQILEAAERPASQAVYLLDKATAQEVINGLLEYDFVMEAEILDERNERLGFGKASARINSQNLNGQHSRLLKYFAPEFETYTKNLFRANSPAMAYGELSIVVDRHQALAGFFERAAFVLVSGVIRNMLLALILFWIFYLLLTKPLLQLARAFSRISPDAPAKTRLLLSSSHRQDELGVLVDTANRYIVASERLQHQQRKAEKAVRVSEERFRDFADTAADWFWETGRNLRFRYLSPKFEESTGMAADEVLGDSIPELFTTLGEDPEKWTRQLSQMESHKPFREFDYSWLAPNGELNVFRISGKPIFDTQDKFAGYRGAARDITEAYQLSQELSYQASHDPLTGHINRRGFEHRLQQLLDSARKDQVEHALLYIDLDQFKLINDTCGHLAGDELLRQISEVLRHLVRRGDTLARVGGDEFGILLERCSLHEAMRIAHTVRKNIEEFRFVWDEHSFAIGVSIGLIAVTDSSESIDVVLKEADAACYAAKDEGRNRVHLYAQDDAALRKRRGEMRWISAIQQALDENRLLLCYQPIIPLHEDATDHVHYELLLRMQDEDGQVIPPGAFLPAAERYSLSTKLDRWVVGSALDWLQGQGEQLERLYSCSINLSGHSLGNEEFLRFVIDKLTQSQVAPEKICFEITEAAATANLVNAMKFINQMKEVGCQFALDDFGSGLSSFAYLKKLPVDFLKIDGLFVKNIASDSIDFSMVKSINEIGHVMGKKTVAEFVEDEEILAKLREIGVDFAQGYAIGRPQPIEQLPKLASHA